jgi:hypothetical protein
VTRDALAVLCLVACPEIAVTRAAEIAAATAEPVVRVGDRSVVLHWRPLAARGDIGYHVERSVGNAGNFVRLTQRQIARPHFVDFNVTNGLAYVYRIRAMDESGNESAEWKSSEVTPRVFSGDHEFLEYLQQTAFDYFWYEANPANGLVRDRSRTNSYCSIAAVGFGLSAIGIGIDHGWLTREQGRERVLRTLKTFRDQPQGAAAGGTIGYKGWFYHFLHMESGLRAWKCELSSIDTALLLAGMVHAREYFDSDHPDEAHLRRLVTEIYDRIDWHWMSNGDDSLTMGWHPEKAFINSRWIGFNEAMILVLLGLGAEKHPLPPRFWKQWTRGYQWRTSHGQSYVHFPPLFGHQYSHCWIDFRGIADGYMRDRGMDYFQNSRRATLAQQAYCIANPGKHKGYSELVWGLTACDGPGLGRFRGYSARGAPPPENDDGTIAPTAAGGSVPFAPEICLPTLRHFYDRYRTNIWTAYGFCDAFNLTANWWDPEVLGIDQGPILIMIENHRTGRVWERFMRAPEIQRGLKAAGFTEFTGLK